MEYFERFLKNRKGKRMQILIDLNEFEQCIGAMKDLKKKYYRPIQTIIDDMERIHLEGIVKEDEDWDKLFAYE